MALVTCAVRAPALPVFLLGTHYRKNGPRLVHIEQLTARTPSVSVEELLKGFYPSPRFGEVSFDSYRPDPSQPSQANAVKVLSSFADAVGAEDNGGLFKKLFAKKTTSRAGIYLDGGFGVGKTHLLAVPVAPVARSEGLRHVR